MNLFGKTLQEIQEIVTDLKFQKFTAKQITDWLYKKEISDIEEMTNLSKKMRTVLRSKYSLGTQGYTDVQKSRDGTKKYLFPVSEDKFVETAFIPERERQTICVSSQVGCKYSCKFCMTGKQGYHGDLTSGEILNQIKSIDESNEITNIVYMGMGEPLDNTDEVLKSLDILTSEYGYAMSPKRITVSTIGVLKGLKRFLEESKCQLAISLHSPFDEERQQIMPVQKSNPLLKVIDLIKKYDFTKQRKVSFEYILFKDFNDSKKHINELSKILHGLKCNVNIINFHNIPGTKLMGADKHTTDNFCSELKRRGIHTTSRKSRGKDIAAACGMLSTKKK